MNLLGLIQSEEDATPVTAEHDAGAVVGQAHRSVFGEVVEHQVGRVDEVAVVDVGQLQLGDRGVEGDQNSGDSGVLQPCGRSSAMVVRHENVVVAWGVAVDALEAGEGLFEHGGDLALPGGEPVG
ncbi:hypothetical protein ACQ4WX_05040 [Streptomyces lasalocidi]